MLVRIWWHGVQLMLRLNQQRYVQLQWWRLWHSSEKKKKTNIISPSLPLLFFSSSSQQQQMVRNQLQQVGNFFMLGNVISLHLRVCLCLCTCVCVPVCKIKGGGELFQFLNLGQAPSFPHRLRLLIPASTHGSCLVSSTHDYIVL